MRLVQVGVSAAICRTVLIYSAEVAIQKRAGLGARLPGIFAAGVRRLEIFLNKLLGLHSQAPRQPLNLVFAERRLHLPAAIGPDGTRTVQSQAGERGGGNAKEVPTKVSTMKGKR